MWTNMFYSDNIVNIRTDAKCISPIIIFYTEKSTSFDIYFLRHSKKKKSLGDGSQLGSNGTLTFHPRYD